MSLVPARYRPYLAGLFGTLATGFGHLYLRRWLRGAGWIALAFVVTMVFVPEQTMESMATGETLSDQTALYPTMIVQVTGALDAFFLARSASDDSGSSITDVPLVGDDASADASPATDAATVACPNCGKEVDAELEFCHWCTTEFVVPESEKT